MKKVRWIREFLKSKWEIQLLILSWLAILLLSPLLIITSFKDQNSIGLGLGIGLTMFFYWITGVITTLLKGWRLND